MQHFQSILIIIGLIAIGGVLVHGYLVSRKEKESVTERGTNVDIFAEQESSQAEDETLSEVRIISQQNEEPETDSIDFSVALEDDKIDTLEFDATETANISDEIQPVEPEQAINIEEPAQEPIITADLEPIVNVEPVDEELASDELLVSKEEPEEEVKQAQDLFIFNVVAKDGEHLGGHELLQFFLTSGFRHGEMSIFHRHENSDGTGPVLFSIANMMAPGVFDTDNMEQFRSEGVSFFLTAPNKDINVRSSFQMMLRAVEQMAEEFDCDVLNADRELMTTEQFIEYNNRLLHYI